MEELKVFAEENPLVNLLAIQQLMLGISKPDQLNTIDAVCKPLREARVVHGGRFRCDQFLLDSIEYAFEGLRIHLQDALEEADLDYEAKGGEYVFK